MRPHSISIGLRFKRELEDKVLLPILGEQYGRVLENQEIQLAYERGRFVITYFQHQCPIAPKSWGRILSFRLEELIGVLGDDDPHIRELRTSSQRCGIYRPAMSAIPRELRNATAKRTLFAAAYPL